MLKKSLSFVLVAVLAVAFMAGCAKAPQELVDSAKAALQAAQASEANRYLAQEFNAIQDSLNKAMTEIETQNSKFALTRSYKNAQTLLDGVVTAANGLNEKVAARKEEVKNEATQKLTTLQTALEDAKKLWKKAPRGKEGREVLNAMQTELNGVEASFADVNTLLTNGDFLSALEKVDAGLKKVQSISEELNTAIAKKAGR